MGISTICMAVMHISKKNLARRRTNYDKVPVGGLLELFLQQKYQLTSNLHNPRFGDEVEELNEVKTQPLHPRHRLEKPISF